MDVVFNCPKRQQRITPSGALSASNTFHSINNGVLVLRLWTAKSSKNSWFCRHFLSSDPGFAFRLGRYIGPVREAKKLGLDGVKRLVDARDHRNHVAGLTRLIRHVFRNGSIHEQSYPIRYVSWNLSFWKIFHITRAEWMTAESLMLLTASAVN